MPLFQTADHFLLRCALSPIEHCPIDRPGLSPATDSLEEGRSEFERVRSLFATDQNRTALAVSSAALYRAAINDNGMHVDTDRVKDALTRYAIRMTTRCTPYGVFAGVALGTWSLTSTVSLDGCSTVSRFDMGWLSNFLRSFAEQPENREGLKLTTHPCVVLRGDRYVLPKQWPFTFEPDIPQASVKVTKATSYVLSQCAQPMQWRTLSHLAAHALKCFGATSDKVDRLIASLLQSGILISDIYLSPVAQDVMKDALELMQAGAEASTEKDLRDLLTDLRLWDSSQWGDRARRFIGLVDRAKTLSGRENDTPFQVDTIAQLQGSSLNSEVGAEIARTAEILLRLSRWPTGLPYLSNYRERFIAKFGNNRFVGILEVIDADQGLGVPSFDDEPESTEVKSKRTHRDEILLNVAVTALHTRNHEVDLSDDLLDRLGASPLLPARLPATLEIFALIAAKSAQDVDSGDFSVVLGANVGTPTAGKAFGRFIHALGKDASQMMASVIATRKIAYGCDAITAEVTYIPQQQSGRLLNLSLRPALTDCVIQTGSGTGVTEDMVLTLDDLFLGVRGGRFILWSRSRNKEVIVSSSHMVHGSNAPIVARLLADLERDGVVQLTGFDWGVARSLVKLPRVSRGRTIFSLAEWRLNSGGISVQTPDSHSSFQELFQGFRETWEVPRHVYLADIDNRLLLDLDHPGHLKFLRRCFEKLPRGGSLVLQEVAPAIDQCWLPGPEGHYMCEVVVPLLRSGLTDAQNPDQCDEGRSEYVAASGVSDHDRLRMPGSDWLYLKLSSTAVLEEELLGKHLYDLQVRVSQQWPEIKMFFIRYTEGERHLRIRWNGTPEHLWGRFAITVHDWAESLVETGFCRRFSIETYEREVERYGGLEGLQVIEKMFAVDSHTVLRLLNNSDLKSDTPFRWSAVVCSLDGLLAALGLDLNERVAWLRSRVRSTKVGGDLYRSLKISLVGSFRHYQDLDAKEASLWVQALRHHQVIRPLGKQLRRLWDDGLLTLPIEVIYESLVHMHCNRLLGVDGRAELQAMELWRRTVEGIHARSRYP